MSLVGEPPLQLTPEDVWQLCKDRFSIAEIAHLAGVSLQVAQGMVDEAIARFRREDKPG